MNFIIEPIYYLFPLISLLFSFIGLGNRRTVKVLLSVMFVLIYSFSLNGSDYSGYQYLYNATAKGASLDSIHGEIGFYYLMKLCNYAGLDYLAFRIGLLSITSFVLFYALAKMSPNFSLSVFFVSTMFVVYTISAYRQYIVIAFSILFIYLYTKGKIKRSIIGLCLLLFFHPTALLPLVCLVYYHLGFRKNKNKKIDSIKANYVGIILFSLAIRVIITGILLFGPIKNIIEKILSGRASSTPTFFSFGLISRSAFLLFISFLYKKARFVETSTRLLFWYYFISITFYISIPLEFAMGRLMNNASIILAILIPVLRYDYDKRPDRIGRIRIKRITAVILLLECIAIAILTNQLRQQDGYSPYLNILRGDEPIILEQYILDKPPTEEGIQSTL